MRRFVLFLILSFSLVPGAFGEEKTAREWVSEGNANYLEGEFKEALQAYREALGEDPDDAAQAKIYYNIGNTYYRMGELKKALQAYREALRRNPDDRDTKMNFEIVLNALAGEPGALEGDLMEIEEGGENALDEEMRLMLERLEQEEFQDPKGVPPPTPPPPDHTPKPYQKDW